MMVWFLTPFNILMIGVVLAAPGAGGRRSADARCARQTPTGRRV